MLLVTFAASLAMLAGLVGELGFALRGGAPFEIGELARFEIGHAQNNQFVRARGEVERIGAIGYARPLERDGFRLVPAAGNPKLWVELRIPAGFDDEHYVPPNVYEGRLLPIAGTGLRHAVIREAAQLSGWRPGHIPKDAWVLIDGETPKSTRWAVGLSALLVGFAGFCLWGLVSLLRSPRSA